MSKKVSHIIIIMFFMTVLSNMAHPVTPELVVSLNMPSLMYGIMFAAMSIASFTMSPIWGSLSDKYKTRKLFLYFPTVGYGLAQIGFGFSTTPIMIIIFRILGGGFASSIFTNSIAYIIDETDNKTRSKAIAYYTAITGFGMSLGYLVGGYIGANDYHNAFIFQAIGLFIHAAIIYFFLPDSNVKFNNPNNKSTHLIFQVKDDFKKYLSTALGTLLLLVLLTSFSYITYSTGINYFLKKYLNLTPLQIGYYMALTGIIGMVANTYLTPKISKKYGDKTSLKYVLLTTGITLIILSFMKNLLSPIAIIIFLVFIFVISMFKPLLQTMVSNLSKDEHGKIMGLQISANSVGMVGGSLFAGALLDIYPRMPFIMSALIFILSYLIIIFSKKLKKY
ncbi:MFS transporter, DHA1 family, multidrug resistance protein [Caminicella sporogenes DSM 14501]|uniref:MFS transporter, DHA1 family, multidrug resistance protein n=1 Tax=Caminicella sporogenes DSM 14501 TaxID=1121266 RepID=A0A1M6TIS1_9FIRM|nr:MFS transporter [Caminicella sporogenes]SHK56803.1 MFS transporter, DHA1 family, multidrug resistance protein [Caminicella sporogenes DSM 14501]